MLPFMKLLPYVPGLVKLIEEGYEFSVRKIPNQERYEVAARWQHTPWIGYAAPSLQEAVELFVMHIEKQVREHL